MNRQELEEGEEMGDGQAEALSAIGDKGQAAVSLTADCDGKHIYIFESLQLKDSYVGDLWNTVILRNFPSGQEDNTALPMKEAQFDPEN